MPRYTNCDYRNMAKCVRECGNIVSEAQTLYAHLYGEKPRARTMLNAAERYSVQPEANSIAEPEVNMESNTVPEIKTEIKIENYEEESCDYDIRLSSIPIVFTTKLEDMRIFDRNSDSMRSKDITDIIFKESMPKYCKQKLIAKPCSKVSYQELKLKINKMNLIAASKNSESDEINIRISTNVDQKSAQLINGDVRERNAKLLKMCKPLRVALEKIAFESDEESEPVKKKKKCDTNNELTYLFVFQDYSINQTDIYCIQDSTITENYTLKNVNDETIIAYISAYNRNNVITRKVSFCCWHQREGFIVSLDPSQFKTHVKEFMKTPHCCPFRHCACCCRSLNETRDDDVSYATTSKHMYSTEIAAEDMEINDLEKEIADTFCELKNNSVEYGYKSDWLEKLLADTKEIDTLVGKALTHNRPLSNLTEDENSNSVLSNNYTTKFVRQFYSSDVNRAETFELQREGNLLAYLNEDIFSKVMPTFYRKTFEASDFSAHRTCCWYEREKKIRTLYSDSPSLARFMKLPHTCLPNDCKCCCKPQKTTCLFNVILPNHNVPVGTEMKKNSTDKEKTKNIVKTYSNFRSAKTDRQSITSAVESVVINSSTDKLTKTGTHDETPVQKITPCPSSLTRKIANFGIQYPADAIVVPPTKNSEKQSNQNNNQIQQDTIVSPANNGAQDLAVDSMITTILDRFKNVRLTINKDGKVSAALKAPADSLNTAELKVLANILAHAQKQVKELGLGPGSFFNANDIQESVNTVTLNVPATQVPKQKLVTSPTEIIPTKASVPKIVKSCHKPAKDKTAIIDELSSISQDHNQSLMQSYSSFVRCKKYQPVNSVISSGNPNSLLKNASTSESSVKNMDNLGGIPKISSVFSLQDSKNDNPQKKLLKSSALGAWSKSANLNSIVVTPKSNTTNSKPQHPQSKIRVVDPEKLGIASNNTVDPVANDKTQFKILNDNLIEAEINPNSNQRKLMPTKIQTGTIPMGHIASEIQSLPIISNVIGNAVISPQTPPNIDSQNNILVINPIQASSHLMTNKKIANFSNNQYVKNVDMNPITQNIQVLSQSSATTVFRISNLDRMSIAEPRLLNAEPVPRLGLNPPPLVKVVPKPNQS